MCGWKDGNHTDGGWSELPTVTFAACFHWLESKHDEEPLCLCVREGEGKREGDGWMMVRQVAGRVSERSQVSHAGSSACSSGVNHYLPGA